MKFDFSLNRSVAKGEVLLAEPFMKDPDFSRGVVLVCDDAEEEHFGFVLNTPVFNIEIDNLFEAVDEYDLFLGGPVEQDTLHFIHRCPDKISDSVEILKGVYHGGDFEQAIELLKFGEISRNDIKFFLGYSGWGKDQLREELNIGSWIVSEISVDDIFEKKGKDLWVKLMKEKGGDYEMVANYPVDPRLN